MKRYGEAICFVWQFRRRNVVHDVAQMFNKYVFMEDN